MGCIQRGKDGRDLIRTVNQIKTSQIHGAIGNLENVKESNHLPFED